MAILPQIELQQAEEFSRDIRSKMSYRTTPWPFPSPRVSPPRFPSLYFQYRQWCAIRDGWRMARRGQLGALEYTALSVRYMRTVERCGSGIEAAGLDHLAHAGKAVVVIGNHMSTLETCLLPCLLLPFGRLAFVVKRALMDYPFFGPIMRAVNPIAVDRVNPREDLKQVLRQGTAMLQAGVSVMIFPQATRSRVLDISLFNTLGVKLAAHAGVPLVPLALQTDFIANGRWIKDLGQVRTGTPVRFAFGPLLQPAGNGRAAHAEVVRFISAHLADWGVPIQPREERHDT